MFRPTRLSLQDRYFFVRQLAALQKAGVPLLASLHALEAQLPAGPLKQTLQAIAARLLDGTSLSRAFACYPESFPPVFIGLIKVGEAGGLLDEVLARLAQLYQWEMSLRGQIRQALQYPMIVLSTLMVSLTIMVVFVLPRFAELFGSLQIRLPIQTRVVLALSRFLQSYGWLVVGLAALGAVSWWAYIRTPNGRLWWHTRLLRLPVIGSLLMQLAMSRVARVLAALSASGVTMLEALALAKESVNNKLIQQRLLQVCDRVRAGEPLAQAFRTDGLFPPVVIQMVATGEESGHIEELLQSVSDYYDQQANDLLRALIAYVEPALLLVVGLGVLLMATAVLVPMWDMVQVFKIGR